MSLPDILHKMGIVIAHPDEGAANKFATGAMWKTAGDVSTTLSEQTVFAITASVQATVGDYAEPQSFSGAWIGQVTTPQSKFASKGSATGALPPQ